MTLSIEFSPAEQARLTRAAHQLGLDVSHYVKKLAIEHIPRTDVNDLRKALPKISDQTDREHFYFRASREEFNQALDDIAIMNKDLPVLDDAAFDRENLYEDRF